jgi:hypothetical protein
MGIRGRRLPVASGNLRVNRGFRGIWLSVGNRALYTKLFKSFIPKKIGVESWIWFKVYVLLQDNIDVAGLVLIKVERF